MSLQVWELRPRLRHLDLSANSLVELPGSRLSHLPGLVALLLSKNQLQSWPLPEAALQLQSLDLSYNPRMPIPASGLQCCHQTLTSLELSGAFPANQWRPLTSVLPAFESATIPAFPTCEFLQLPQVYHMILCHVA